MAPKVSHLFFDGTFQLKFPRFGSGNLRCDVWNIGPFFLMLDYEMREIPLNTKYSLRGCGTLISPMELTFFEKQRLKSEKRSLSMFSPCF